MAFICSLESAEETLIEEQKLGSFLVIVNAQAIRLGLSRKVLDLRVLKGEFFGDMFVWVLRVWVIGWEWWAIFWALEDYFWENKIAGGM